MGDRGHPIFHFSSERIPNKKRTSIGAKVEAKAAEFSEARLTWATSIFNLHAATHKI